MNHKAIDFVVVTFREELNVLKLQAASFGRFVNIEFCNSINIIINDEYEFCKKFIFSEVYPLLGDLKDRIRIWDINDLVSFPMRPYLRQQVAKMTIAQKLDFKHYVCLDSKNIFVRQMRMGDFFVDDRPRGAFQSLKGDIQVKSCKLYCELFDIAPLHEGNSVLAIMTPFVMIREMVLKVIVELERACSAKFDEAFACQPAHSEFMLYFIGLQKIGLDPAKAHVPSHYLSRTFWGHSAVNPGEFEMALSSMGEETLMIGLHRKRISNFTNDEHIYLNNFLNRRGMPDLVL